MTTDKAAIAAWAARKKQRKDEAKTRETELQKQFAAKNYPELSWSSFPVVGIPEVKATVETFNEQRQTMPVIKGLSYDLAKGMYRARAYKDNRQINLYWGASRDQAIAALVQYRATGVNPNV